MVGDFFDCSDNQLTSLDGAPQSVGGFFDCSDNQLTSLEGAPKSVGTGFYCSKNQLTSLKGAPKSVGSFGCSDNQLTNLLGGPESCNADFRCLGNPLTSLVGLPKLLGSLRVDKSHLDINSMIAPKSIRDTISDFTDEEKEIMIQNYGKYKLNKFKSALRFFKTEEKHTPDNTIGRD